MTNYSTAEAYSPCEAWVGTSANLDMLFMSALHGIVKFQVDKKNEPALKDAILFGLGTTLSDIVDAEVQGKNVPAGASAFFDRNLAAAYVATLLIQKKTKNGVTCPVMTIPPILERRAAFALADMVRPQTKTIFETRELDGVTYIRPIVKPVLLKNGMIKRGLGFVNPGRWSVVENMNEYVDNITTHVDLSLAYGCTLPDLQHMKSMASELLKGVVPALYSQVKTCATQIHESNKLYGAELQKIADVFGNDTESDEFKNFIRGAQKAHMARIMKALGTNVLATPESARFRDALVLHVLSNAQTQAFTGASYDEQRKQFRVASGSLSILKIDDYVSDIMDENGKFLEMHGLYREACAVISEIAEKSIAREIKIPLNLKRTLKMGVFTTIEEADGFMVKAMTQPMTLADLFAHEEFESLFRLETSTGSQDWVKSMGSKEPYEQKLARVLKTYGSKAIVRFSYEDTTSCGEIQKRKEAYGYYCGQCNDLGLEAMDQLTFDASVTTCVMVHLESNGKEIMRSTEQMTTLKTMVELLSVVKVQSCTVPSGYICETFPDLQIVRAVLLGSSKMKDQFEELKVKPVFSSDWDRIVLANKSKWLVAYRQNGKLEYKVLSVYSRNELLDRDIEEADNFDPSEGVDLGEDGYIPSNCSFDMMEEI
jgi:hypothetical protein